MLEISDGSIQSGRISFPDIHPTVSGLWAKIDPMLVTVNISEDFVDQRTHRCLGTTTVRQRIFSSLCTFRFRLLQQIKNSLVLLLPKFHGKKPWIFKVLWSVSQCF